MSKLTILNKLLPYLIAVFLIFYCWNVYWGGKRWDGFFLSDSGGYYGYLPATFIYNDYNFSFIGPIQENNFLNHGAYDFRSSYNGKNIDKWFCGTAVAIAPFFLTAHVISLIKGAQADGYTFWYAWGLNIAAIFYLLIGLLALRKVLQHYFRNEGLISLVLVFIVFATNVFYYATSEPAMSHVYSFAFINLFVLCAIKMSASSGKKHILLLGILLGIIVLIRPVNGFIVLILPFIAGSKSNFMSMLTGLKTSWKKVCLSVLLFLSVLFIQFIYYKLETGNWLIYAYGDEKMDLLKPHLFDFLFSYKKGLFVYLPLTLLSLVGSIFLFRKNKWQFYSLSIFIFSLCYILSCWWNWWYGGSFGTRPLIEYLFIFSILLGTAIENLQPAAKKIFVTLCFLCLVNCQVQNYQYRYYFIHWDKMTKQSYWKVFMRVDLMAKKENPNANLIK